MIPSPLASLARSVPVHRLCLGLADDWRLRRGSEGRLSFPFIQRRRRAAFQILMFHRVNDDEATFFPGVPVDRFRRQMESLARSASVLPLAELADRAGADDLPPRSVAITFDDGYRDNYEHAFPVLRRLGLPATIFVTTDPIERGTPLWHDRVFEAFERAGDRPLALDARTLPMAPLELRRRTLREILGHLRRETPEGRERLVAEIERGLGREDPLKADGRMLTWEQIREMSHAGISIGAHTVSHPILTRMPLEAAVEEIRGSRAVIEHRVGVPVDQFAYPNGSAEDFNEELKEVLRSQGFRCAVTTVWGVNDASSDPYGLRRIGFWDAEPELLPLRLAWYRFAA